MRLYKENCDMLIKVLHIPTVEPLILQPANCGTYGRLETLMLAICYSVVVSLSGADRVVFLGSEKGCLLRSYRFAMEQSLAQARLLETEEMIVLQALVIYLADLAT